MKKSEKHRGAARRLIALTLAGTLVIQYLHGQERVDRESITYPGARLHFSEVTEQSGDFQQSLVTWRSSFVDLNQDGCFDIVYGSHSDSQYRPVYLQNRAASGCLATFVLLDNSIARYVQSSPQIPRITSNNWYYNVRNNPGGEPDLGGDDSDGSAPALYPFDAIVNGLPRWGDKISLPGSLDGKPLTLVFDADGNGVMDVLSWRRNTGDLRVSNASTGQILWTGKSTYAHPYLVFDIDGDGWPDMYPVMNGKSKAGSPGYWKSDTDGTFTWTTGAFSAWDGVQSFTPGQSEGAAGGLSFVFDYDLDGDFDIFIGEGARDTTPSQFCVTVQINNGDGTYTSDEQILGCLQEVRRNQTVPYGKSVAADFDNNGYVDIMFNQASTAISLSVQNYFFYMNFGGQFYLSETTPNFGGGEGGLGVAPGVADFDNDGDLDITKPSSRGTISVWENRTSTGNRWLNMTIRGFGGNTDGIHTIVTAYRPSTTQIVASYQKLTIATAYSTSGHHLGLGENDMVDLRVTYPHGGPNYWYRNVNANQHVILFRDGCMGEGYAPGGKLPVQSSQVSCTTPDE
ncbi:MAG: VCBS repeat-containing protein [Pseudomonadota bacterium]